MCPVWCNRPLGHEYEDETRTGEPLSHHVREVLKVPASLFGHPCDVTVTVISTETVSLGSDGVSVTATAPAFWVTVEDLKTLEASSFDLDPTNAGLLGETLNRNVRTLLDSL
jgi:hypothetical protein